jgi:dipeptidase
VVKYLGEHIDFAKTFSDAEKNYKYAGRRIWRAFSLLNPDAYYDPDYEDIF